MYKEYEVQLKKQDGSGWRVVSHAGAKVMTKAAAVKLRNSYKAKGRQARVRKAKLPRDHKVLVKKNIRGWREVSKWRRKRFTKPEAFRLRDQLKRRGREAKIRKIKNPRYDNNVLIEKWLSGDLDFDRQLMVALAKVARDRKVKLHVNYGKRTYAEQAALYAKYGPGRAAKPGTSRHETGKAADVVLRRMRWVNLGSIWGIRKFMRKRGVGLPVSGEAWHAELTSVFNA